MNKNQFFYTREIEIPVKASDAAGAKPQVKKVLDSFNVSLVIRSIVLETGQRLVLLNDLHERNEKVEIQNKSGKVTGYKNERNTYQSEIYLSPEDSERFIEAVQI